MTSESFDPYHKWLGIPPHEQPPNHYRLLRISDFESDAEVIEHAYDKEMGDLKQQEYGPHAEFVEQLSRELIAAHNCLLDAVKKEAYDAELRTRIETEQEGDELAEELARRLAVNDALREAERRRSAVPPVPPPPTNLPEYIPWKLVRGDIVFIVIEDEVARQQRFRTMQELLAFANSVLKPRPMPVRASGINALLDACKLPSYQDVHTSSEIAVVDYVEVLRRPYGDPVQLQDAHTLDAVRQFLNLSVRQGASFYIYAKKKSVLGAFQMLHHVVRGELLHR